MRVSIVITTYNRRNSLERCLESLAQQTFPVNAYEVVVVADGCSDDTNAFLATYEPLHRFCWLSQTNHGQPTAQNLGIAAAIGDLVILMDDDCICERGLVAAHSEAHLNEDLAVVIGAVLLHPDTPRGTPGDIKRQVEDTEFARLNAGEIRRSDLMLCANSSIARQTALECPFDPAYKRMHDVEAGLRLWAKGYRPKFVANAVAYEFFTKSVEGVLSDSRYEGKYEVLLTALHPEFKPLAALVRINEGNPLKRWLRKQMATHASLSGSLLAMVYGLAEPLRRTRFFALLANRVLRARAGLQHVRGAIEQAGSWDELERRFGVRTPVIIYHNVGTPNVGEFPGLTTPAAVFEAQIQLLLKMGYRSILPFEWLNWRQSGGALPDRPVMLVFDDGYQEACRIAFPIIEKYGFCAACMVVTRFIGSTNRWDEEAGRPTLQLMSEEQIGHWSRKGIEFGGHTHTHPELPFESDERVEQEVAQCKEDLTRLLGKPPSSFAYPFGSFSAPAEAAVSRHFPLGFTSWPGRLHLGTNTSLIPRIAFLPGESNFGMWCRLRLGRNPLEFVRNRWRKITGCWREDEV